MLVATSLRAAQCLPSGIFAGAALVTLMADKEEEEDLPWDRPRPPLEGDMPWTRDPEQGSRPDQSPPFVPAWPKRLSAGPVASKCPKCRSTDLRHANDLGYWCRGCQTAFSRPMSEFEALIFFTRRTGA